MMRVELQVLAALALDYLFGDPRWLPHPVRLLGRLASSLEAPARRLFPARAAGAIVALTVISAAALSTRILVGAASVVHPLAGDLIAVLVLWTTFAARDLAVHAAAVHQALGRGDLDEARRCVGRMVGRDTDALDEPGVIRATVESVAENTVDGVTAPLFFACLFGPCGAMAYKAINTLDSTFGYKNERYLLFGWASARLDDVANFLPARLTVPLVALAAAALGLRPWAALRICRRDGHKHPSPNSGMTEAAVAGALGVQLGGPVSYAGRSADKPTLGDALVPLQRRHIPATVRLMVGATAGAAALFLLIRWSVLHAWA
jgi:adenosylcobinamide-phosphate synthase